jgi:signal transduction histidine kinase
MLVKTLFDTLDPAAKNKEVTLRLIGNEEYSIEVDPVILRNILDNLISNAINYSRAGGEAVVSIENKLNELTIVVKDSGIGIPKEEQRQIFNRFYRASNAKIFDTRGTGLGLYMAKLLAKKIDATISFESEEEKGSMFYLHIPYSQIPLPENVTRV